MITDWNEKHFYKAVGQSLKIARERAGLNQSDLARLIGLTRTSVTNMESGNQSISLYYAALIVEVLPEWGGALTMRAPDASPRCRHEWYHSEGQGDKKVVCSKCGERR
jgi:DNA-binding XRE family transcriptional regulator